MANIAAWKDSALSDYNHGIASCTGFDAIDLSTFWNKDGLCCCKLTTLHIFLQILPKSIHLGSSYLPEGLTYEYTERDALTPLSDSNVSLVVPKERYDAGDGGS